MSTATDFMIFASAGQQRTILGASAQPAKPKSERATHTDLSVNGTCSMDGCNNVAEHECDGCRPNRFCGNCSTATHGGGRMCYTCFAAATAVPDD